jgi:hypothetical protein
VTWLVYPQFSHRKSRASPRFRLDDSRVAYPEGPAKSLTKGTLIHDSLRTTTLRKAVLAHFAGYFLASARDAFLRVEMPTQRAWIR